MSGLRLLFLRALTPVHAGAGRGASEHVDLPVQRDEFNFPCIWASSLKGALRSLFTRTVEDKSKIREIFGPEPSRGHESSSLVNFLDARLLFMPARSLKGIWTYLTSPHLIYYLITYLEGTKQQEDKLSKLIKSMEQLSLPVTSNKGIFVHDNTLVLNEVDITDCNVKEDLIKSLFDGILPNELLNLICKKGLVIVDDDLALNLVQRSMVIQYRIRINYTTKTVVGGSLWSEEYVPQETVFVSGIVYRSSIGSSNIKALFSWFENELERLKYVWLGGKETIGKGLLKMYII